MKNKSLSAKWVMIWLAILFLVPFLGGYWYFYYVSQQDDVNTTNYGELVSPPIMIETLPLTNRYGRSIPIASWQGTWQLIYVLNQVCDSQCGEHLDSMFRLHIALNKNQQRLQRALIVSEAVIAEQGTQLEQLLQDSYPGTMLVVSQSDLISRLSIDSDFILNAESQGVYLLADPIGNIMMYYPATADVNKILSDIEKLMRISKIG